MSSSGDPSFQGPNPLPTASSYQQRQGRHSVYALQVHIVFITKYRRKLLRREVQERCRDLVRQTCDALDVRILKGVVSADHVHVHLHLSYPAKLSVSDLVRRVKGRSARKLVQEYPNVRRRYGGGFWGIGYGAWSTGAITDEMVNEYLWLNPQDSLRYPSRAEL